MHPLRTKASTIHAADLGNPTRRNGIGSIRPWAQEEFHPVGKSELLDLDLLCKGGGGHHGNRGNDVLLKSSHERSCGRDGLTAHKKQVDRADSLSNRAILIYY